MSMGNDLNRTLAEFTSQMYDYVFNEDKMKKRRKEEKKHFHFFDCQVRTGHGF